jgi:hypothetical protein
VRNSKDPERISSGSLPWFKTLSTIVMIVVVVTPVAMVMPVTDNNHLSLCRGDDARQRNNCN